MKNCRIILVIISLSVSACATTQKPVADPEYASVRPVSSQPIPISNGAIYRSGYQVSLFEDKKAKRIGDLITVMLSETTSSSKKASTTTKKDSDVDISTPNLFGRTGVTGGFTEIDNELSAKRSFKGEGDSSQSNSLFGTITVTVSDIYPNGNLLIRGEKLMTLNQGVEHIKLSGIVRGSDVTPDNTIKSSQIANARIIYGGDGVIADTNTKGWLQRFFDSSWWPF